MSTYKVINNKTKEFETFNDRGLKIFIKEAFPNANQNFLDYLFTKRLENSTIPYNNGIFTISCTTAMKKKNKSLDFSSKYKIQENQNPNACKKHIFNEWTIFNKTTGKYCVFPNLSALARSLNINYSWLYSSIKKYSDFSINEYIFTCNKTLESLYYKKKLQNIL